MGTILGEEGTQDRMGWDGCDKGSRATVRVQMQQQTTCNLSNKG